MTGPPETQGRVLVAGVGNIFLGDDGFGVEVARRLTERPLPDGVQVGDYGTSGMHLAYDLADHGYETTILVDAAPRGETPGTLTVLEVRSEDRADLASAGGPQLFNGHGMQPEVVLGVLDMLGAEPGRILVVACEPASAEPGMSLSAPVEAAVTEAVALVTRLVTEATSPPAFHKEKTGPQRTDSDERALVAPPAGSED
ncbi:MAG TPA: hydrogenase maturation protease [Streptosporangiaceae bacterium]|jgi:hydrogenase maturation protease|nr:hydrogenase maturation protease [Streptosporangiaceae bacterium]